MRLASLRASQRAVLFITKLNKEDLIALQKLLETGRMSPVIDRLYGLNQVREAFTYMGGGHAKGKIVITL